uniref:Uncharacterized protein n=1 Tax=Tetranychus urticae TaxID=32264 RepID=T1KTT7_TETUR
MIQPHIVSANYGQLNSHLWKHLII